MPDNLLAKLLKEFRCRECNKLLCKAFLSHKICSLQVKCRRCGRVSFFTGADAEVMAQRAELVKKGLISDKDVD